MPLRQRGLLTDFMKSLRIVSIVTLALAGQFTALAELKLPAIFNDNMVLQQQLPVPVWGWSEPGAAVTVQFSGQTQTTRADDQGRWRVKLEPLPAAPRRKTWW